MTPLLLASPPNIWKMIHECKLAELKSVQTSVNFCRPGVRSEVVLHGFLLHGEQAGVLVQPGQRGTGLLVLAS